MAVGEIPEPWPRRISAFEHAHHLLRAPVGDVAVFGEVPGAVEVIVVAHAAGELLAGVSSVAEEEFVVVYYAVLQSSFFAEDDIVKSDAVALGMDVQFADGVSLIPGIAKGLCDSREAV